MSYDFSMEPLFLVNVLCHCLFLVSFTTVKSRIECIEILGIKTVLYDAQGFTEPLEVYNFPCT